MLATLSLLVALAPPHAHVAPRRIAAPSRAAVVVAAAATPETQEALINKLRSANAAQLPALLGDNMGAVDQRLFLRLAELSDAASDDAERDAISQLASTVATVVEDLLNQGKLDLSQVQVAVLDEADHMCELGFLEPVQRILRATAKGSQKLFLQTANSRHITTQVDFTCHRNVFTDLNFC